MSEVAARSLGRPTTSPRQRQLPGHDDNYDAPATNEINLVGDRQK